MLVIYKRRPTGFALTRRESEGALIGEDKTDTVKRWTRKGYKYVGEFATGADIRLSDGEFALVKKL